MVVEQLRVLEYWMRNVAKAPLTAAQRKAGSGPLRGGPNGYCRGAWGGVPRAGFDRDELRVTPLGNWNGKVVYHVQCDWMSVCTALLVDAPHSPHGASCPELLQLMHRLDNIGCGHLTYYSIARGVCRLYPPAPTVPTGAIDMSTQVQSAVTG
ncbi:hypothetical protein CYMTET_42581 [Cymbomonas tetramitiformis]|uniref:Uncharacterized protein n=1 Tax=Cymbomonas tetramitiformis TaxID=36881 RepID=A0AAE0BBI5_9CHLO|nr:hypothetical protein CYMTET_56155 [Cymbomonas tetramitiformis]KAK3247937.1 hypothetical protein CYMTET_42581 [Cymbomonas tetramitiformis]